MCYILWYFKTMYLIKKSTFVHNKIQLSYDKNKIHSHIAGQNSDISFNFSI